MATSSRSSHLTALDIWAFAVPAISFLEITLIGRLRISEVLMLVMLPWLWSAADRPRIPRWFLTLWAAWLISQIVTDLVVGSAFADFTRGWAAIAFTLTNFAAILVLASTPRRARLFALGLASGGVVGLAVAPNVYAAIDPWKWALAIPVGYALAAALSGGVGARRPWLPTAAFVAFGALNLLLGYRSLGGVSLLTAGYLALGAVSRRWMVRSVPSVPRAAAGLALLCLIVWGVLQAYDAAASGGLLGPAAQATFRQQSGTLGVLVGGRSEMLASSQAIIDSPILGHGSWAKDFTYVDLLADRRSSFGYEGETGYADAGVIPTHSYLMGSWVWAGLFGGLFWLAVLVVVAWLLSHLYSCRVDVAPLIVFALALLLWNIAFSPYAFTERLIAPFAVVLCLMGLRLVRAESSGDLPAGVAVGPKPAVRPWGGNRQPVPEVSRRTPPATHRPVPPT